MWMCISVYEYVVICNKTTVHELNDCTTYKLGRKTSCNTKVDNNDDVR
jgi:hypothetical protein